MKTTDIIRRLYLFFFALMRVEPTVVEAALLHMSSASDTF